MRREKKTVVVGTVGAGYASHLHGNGYMKVNGVDVRLKTVSDLNLELAQKLKDTFGYEEITPDYHDILNDPEIDVVDIVVPPFLHAQVAIDAMRAGKHVICEKPLTGYFGEKGQEDIGNTVSKAYMYKKCLEEMDAVKKVVEETGMKFMYAENFVYASPVQKAAEILRAKKTKILYMKGEEALKGSSSPLAGKWNRTGGGCLMRTGSHPLGGMLWLKQQEAKARGEEITIKSITCDVGRSTPILSEEEHRHIKAYPEDVEDYGVISITFSDDTKALCIASDSCLGGTRNYIDIYGNDTALNCNITPTDILNSYFLDEDGLDDVYISEMLPQKLGWNKVFVNDEIIRGYTGELQNFMETVAYDLEPVSGFQLAYDVTRVLYAAYQSAEEGRRIDF